MKERLGGLLLFVCFGQSGRKVIESCLKMKSSPSTNLEVLLSNSFCSSAGAVVNSNSFVANFIALLATG